MDICNSSITKPRIPNTSIISSRSITKASRKKFLKQIPKNNIENFDIPFFVSTTCVNNGKNVIFSKGNNHEIIKASSALPLVSEPVIINNKAYIDGGVTNNFPVKCLKDLKLDLIIGINVNHYKSTEELKFKARNLLMRTLSIFVHNTCREKKYCDIYICPEKLGNYSIFDFGKIEELINIGYESTKKAINEYKAS